jgi:hypothetical protein
MLILRPDQLTLTIADEQPFINWFVDIFMPEFLDDFYTTIDREILIQRIRFARNKALSFGFNDPICTTHFVWLMWEIGPDFYTFSGYKEIAEATWQNQTERIDCFYHGVTDEQDKAAMFGTDISAWNFS